MIWATLSKQRNILYYDIEDYDKGVATVKLWTGTRDMVNIIMELDDKIVENLELRGRTWRLLDLLQSYGERKYYVSKCPELGVASCGDTAIELY